MTSKSNDFQYPENPKYQFLISEETAKKVSEYKSQLENSSAKAGKFLKDVVEKGISDKKFADHVKGISDEEFLELLIQTKRPKFFAESAIEGNGSDWNTSELSILGDVNCSVPVTIYDNGVWRGKGIKTHDKPFEGELLFVPGTLLKSKNNNSPDYSEIIENGKVNRDKFYSLYERRLLPSLIHASNSAGAAGAVVTIPGMGCGAFAGKFSGQLEPIFKETLLKIIKEHGEKFKNIKEIHFDPNVPNFTSLDGTEEIEGIKLVTKTGKYGAENSQLKKPEEYNPAYKGCKFFSIVAWDHVSWAGNDFYEENTRHTDDGVKAAATNTCAVMTGIEGKYDRFEEKIIYNTPYGDTKERTEVHYGYRPHVKDPIKNREKRYKDWNEVIKERNIQLRAKGNVKVLSKEGNLIAFSQFEKNAGKGKENSSSNSKSSALPPSPSSNTSAKANEVNVITQDIADRILAYRLNLAEGAIKPSQSLEVVPGLIDYEYASNANILDLFLLAKAQYNKGNHNFNDAELEIFEGLGAIKNGSSSKNVKVLLEDGSIVSFSEHGKDGALSVGGGRSSSSSPTNFSSDWNRFDFAPNGGNPEAEQQEPSTQHNQGLGADSFFNLPSSSSGFGQASAQSFANNFPSFGSSDNFGLPPSDEGYEQQEPSTQHNVQHPSSGIGSKEGRESLPPLKPEGLKGSSSNAQKPKEGVNSSEDDDRSRDNPLPLTLSDDIDFNSNVPAAPVYEVKSDPNIQGLLTISSFLSRGSSNRGHGSNREHANMFSALSENKTHQKDFILKGFDSNQMAEYNLLNNEYKEFVNSGGDKDSQKDFFKFVREEENYLIDDVVREAEKEGRAFTLIGEPEEIAGGKTKYVYAHPHEKYKNDIAYNVTYIVDKDGNIEVPDDDKYSRSKSSFLVLQKADVEKEKDARIRNFVEGEEKSLDTLRNISQNKTNSLGRG